MWDEKVNEENLPFPLQRLSHRNNNHIHNSSCHIRYLCTTTRCQQCAKYATRYCSDLSSKDCAVATVGLFFSGAKLWGMKVPLAAQVNVHKKCAHLLPANCQIHSESAVAPCLEQMSMSEQQAGSVQHQQGHQSTEAAMDLMIPLARLPGTFFGTREGEMPLLSLS